MSRVEKLQRRLRELEDELEGKVIAELKKEAAGETSRFLSRRMSSYLDGGQYRRPDVGGLESLFTRVMALKDKLSEDSSSGATGVVLR
jgi:hypothetical protein